MTAVAPVTAVGPVFRVDPAFAEAVVRRLFSPPDGRLADDALGYQRRLEPAYRVADPLARDAAFARLAVDEFERLGLADPLRQAIAERPSVAQRVRLVLLGDARGGSDEGVTWEPGGAHLGMRVADGRFDEPDGLLAWARHVLGHAADTLDPTFGYRAGWEATAGGQLAGATHARLHRLWDVTVDSRLAADGLLDHAARQRHRAILAADLPGVDADALEAVLGLLWDGPRPTFPELLAWASRPADLVTAVAPAGSRSPRPDRCPLCRFPSDDVAVPSPRVASLIAADYPDWRADLGTCGRCTDRYRFSTALGGAA